MDQGYKVHQRNGADVKVDLNVLNVSLYELIIISQTETKFGSDEEH